MGYKTKRGGFGTVSDMVTLHAMVRNHANISTENLIGELFQSSLTQRDNPSIIFLDIKNSRNVCTPPKPEDTPGNERPVKFKQ
jgi:hypothetical protein